MYTIYKEKNRELMENQRKDQSDNFDQSEHLQNIAQLINNKQESEKNYKLHSSKEQFLKNHLKNLRHDLKSPLGGIIGMLDLLIDEDKDKVEVRTQDLTMIRETTQALLDLVNDTFVVRDNQKCMIDSTNIDRKLSSAMKEIHRLYIPMAKNKGISLSLSTHIEREIELPPNLFLNLIQITGNLVANAIKFTPQKGSVEVVYGLDEADDDHSELNMTVTDTGKGMTPDQVSAFNQGKPIAKSTGTIGEEGSGIGLQHVRQMVFEVDGCIFMKSKKGSGTTFSLSFPLQNVDLNDEGSFPFITKIRSLFLNGSPN